jgi:GT2 family glycosyltransferase
MGTVFFDFVSVVIITRNQAWNTARLVESVLANAKRAEVTLVDSASTDQTVEIAARYPISVLLINQQQRLTAALGRNVGYLHSTGDIVLFLDGDMELCAGWLERAIETFSQNPDLAVLTGKVVDLPLATLGPAGDLALDGDHSLSVTDIRQGGGAAAYRRSVLEEVGLFIPDLYSYEEPELCIRIRQSGYRVGLLDYPIAYHYSAPSDRPSTVLGRWRRNLYLGSGQVIRHHWRNPVLWPFAREFGYGIVPLLILIALTVSGLIAHRFGMLGTFAIVSVFSLGGFVGLDALRRRNLNRTLAGLLHRIFAVEGTIRGFFLKTQHSHASSAQVDVIKVAENPP